MPWPQHWHQAWPMGHRVRNYPASPYPRPSARAVTEGSRVRVSGSGLGLAAHACVTNSCAHRWQVLALIPLQYPTEVRTWWYFCGQGTRYRSPGSCAAVSWMWRCTCWSSGLLGARASPAVSGARRGEEVDSDVGESSYARWRVRGRSPVVVLSFFLYKTYPHF